MIVSPKQLGKILQNMPSHMIKAQERAVDYFGRKLLKRHFTFSGQKDLQLKPLSPNYSNLKRRKYGLKPLLVASGRLKKKVVGSAQAIRRGNRILLNVSYPRYGAYQRRDGRDFLQVPPRDKRDILVYLRRQYKYFRKNPLKV